LVKSMSRTKKDITVAGRTTEEVRIAVQKWFGENGVKVTENSPGCIKGRWGIGLATAPKYFQVSFTQTEEGVIAQTEGWITAFGLKDQEFSSSAVMGGIPKREGWRAMERLWSMLQDLASGMRVPLVTHMGESEQILYRFDCTGTKTEYFELVFTPSRMIIAKTGGQPYLGVGGVLSALGRATEKTAELKKFTPEQILADNPENVSIAYSEIIAVAMNRPDITGIGRINIQTAEKHCEFTTRGKREFPIHIDFIRSLLKEKVIVR
jgi:hypothetical protein